MLGHHLNKSVFVSIPEIFNDDAPRLCRLAGVEVSGLWLEGEDLESVLFPEIEKPAPRQVFVPFTQIRYLLDSSASPPEPPPLAEPAPGVRHAKSAADAAPKKKR